MCMFGYLKPPDIMLSIVSSQKLDWTHTFDTHCMYFSILLKSVESHLKTTNFDTFHQGMSLQHMFQISLPNSEFDYAIDNVWVVCFVLSFVTTLLLSCFDKEKMFIERRIMERHLLGG